MTQNSRPWSGDAVGDAGPYSDAQWQQLWRNLIGAGERANYGVILGSGTPPFEALVVRAQSPATASIDVLPGAALVRGIFYLNDDTESFVIASNSSGDPRIDTVVLRADYSLQSVRLALKQGTPAVTPVAPSLTQVAGVMWEIPIADVDAADGFTSISNADIRPRREYANAPVGVYLDGVQNNSGGDLRTGDLVVVDTSANRAATTTTTPNDRGLAGAWVGTTANSGYGRVQVSGIGLVRTVAAVTRGDLLTSSTTAKAAAAHAGPVARVGRALETTSSAGLVMAWIDVQVRNDDISCRVYNSTNTTINAGGASAALAFNQEEYDTDGMHDTSTNNNRITFRTAGKYRVELIVRQISAGVNMTSTIRQGGATIIAQQRDASSQGVTLSVTKLFASGEYVEAFLTNNGGSNITIDGQNTFFSAHLTA